MIRTLTSAILLFSLTVAYAQEQVKFCYSDRELMGKNWHVADEVSVEDKYPESSYFGLTFQAAEKKVDRELRNKALYVSYHDTLYINCNKASNASVGVYAKAIKVGYNMFFVMPYSGIGGLSVGGSIAGLTLGALTGVGFIVYQGISDARPFLWEMSSETLTMLTPRSMEKLLSVDRGLRRQYSKESKERRLSPDVMLSYLQQLESY
jgi:hypothetical protein